jgi:MFS family permease
MITHSGRNGTGRSSEFLWSLFILFLVEFVRGAFLISYLPSFAIDRLHLSISIVGFAVSVHYLADSFIKCFVGYLLDRVSPKIVVNCGLFLSLSAICLMVNAHSEWLLITAAALLGIGGSPIWLICLSHVQEDKRASQMGVLYVFWMSGLGLGPVIINFFMDIGYTAAFSVMIGLFAIGWLFAARMRLEKQAAVFTLTIKEQGRAMWSRLSSMGFLLPGMVLQTTAGGILVPLLSPFATQHIGLSHSELSIALVTGGLCAVLLLIPMGRLTDSLGGKWFLVSGFGVFALAIYRLTYAKTFAETETLSVILGLSYAMLLPAWNSLIAQYVPKESVGTGWGMISTIEGSGVIIGPMLGGYLAERLQPSFPFWVCAAIFALISGFYLFSPGTRFQTNTG